MKMSEKPPPSLIPVHMTQNPYGKLEIIRTYPQSHDQGKIQQLAHMFEETLKNQQLVLRGQNKQGQKQDHAQSSEQETGGMRGKGPHEE